jgi:RHS repeat-associated protein
LRTADQSSLLQGREIDFEPVSLFIGTMHVDLSMTEFYARASRSTGTERDTESGNDYFGARYYASSMGRFISPDWSAKLAPVPYARLGNPQTLNLYGYVGNNPLSAVDPDGHQNTPGGTQCGQTVSIACNNLGDGPAGEAAAELRGAEAQYAAQVQQQSGSSGGAGFWSHVGQRFSNWWDGRGFHDNMHLKENVTDFETYQPLVTASSDLLGVSGAVLRNTPMGIASTVVSVTSDPSPLNIMSNSESILIPLAIPGADVPIAFGYAAWDGSQFAGNTMTTVFTPDALQSNTINVNGITLQDPQAAFDSGSW